MLTHPLVAASRTPAQELFKDFSFSFGPILRETLVICGCLFLATMLTILWFNYIRKPRRRALDPNRIRPPQSSGTHESDEGTEGERRVKYRERKRDHRPRNPTLSETGGLPPPRTQPPSDSTP